MYLVFRGGTGMEIAPGVSVDPGIHHGVPVIAGTRIPVSIVVGSFAGGMSRDDIKREYGLSGEQVDAALAYAAGLVADTEVIALAGT